MPTTWPTTSKADCPLPPAPCPPLCNRQAFGVKKDNNNRHTKKKKKKKIIIKEGLGEGRLAVGWGKCHCSVNAKS